MCTIVFSISIVPILLLKVVKLMYIGTDGMRIK